MYRFLPLAFVLLITSCVSNETSDSKNVKQSEIYQNYNVTWTNGEGSVTASFRFGGENGTTLRLTNPSKVTCNGKLLTESKFLFGGVYYDRAETKYPVKHVFRFVDTDGKTYENSIDFEPVEFVKAPGTVPKASNLELDLSRPVTAAEQIILAAESDTSKSNEMLISTDPADTVYYDTGRQKLVIKPGFFRGFKDVPATIWLEKSDSRKPLEQATNLGGQLFFSYQSKEIKVKRLNQAK